MRDASIHFHAHWIAGEKWMPDHWWNARNSREKVEELAVARFRKQIGVGGMGVSEDGVPFLHISSEDGRIVMVEKLDENGDVVATTWH
jgi:hypothetical protein